MRYAIWTKQTLILAFSVCLAVILVLTGISVQLRTEPAAARQTRKLPIYCVETPEKKLAVTFDAAWGAEDTQKLLEILKKHNAKATFFIVGDWVRKHPDSVKAFYAEGHEIANHSDSHKAYDKLSKEQIAEDIGKCNSAVQQVIGVRPALLRAPSGAYSDETIEAAEALGMKTIQWSVDSLDWQGLEADEITSRVLAAAGNGSILLFHNDVKNTPQALDMVLAELSKRGYLFVTVSELVYPDSYRIDAAGRQRREAADTAELK